MIGEAQIGVRRIAITVILALALGVMPLPSAVQMLRPDWLLLVVFYWVLNAPRWAGLAFAWLCGFAVDVAQGVVLGQHAMLFVVIAAFTHSMQLRLRIYPIWQQAANVGVLALAYQGLLTWTDALVGHPANSWLRLLPPVIDALLWPALVAVLDTWNRRRR
jgi:rod shape-determining protein MreD